MWVVLTLTLLAQAPSSPTPAPLVPAAEPIEAPVEAAPREKAPTDDVPEAPSVVGRRRAVRVLAAGGAGVGAAGLALLVVMLTSAQNPALDNTFGNAAFGALAVSGVAFWVHSLLGGRGEVVLGFLLAGLGYLGGTLAALAIDPKPPATLWWTTALSALPAAALAVLGLEGTTALPRPTRESVAVVPLTGGGAALVLGGRW